MKRIRSWLLALAGALAGAAAMAALTTATPTVSPGDTPTVAIEQIAPMDSPQSFAALVPIDPLAFEHTAPLVGATFTQIDVTTGTHDFAAGIISSYNAKASDTSPLAIAAVHELGASMAAKLTSSLTGISTIKATTDPAAMAAVLVAVERITDAQHLSMAVADKYTEPAFTGADQVMTSFALSARVATL